MTTYKAALGLCGFSQAEAAKFHSVSLSTIKDWCRGKTPPPPRVWRDLAELWRRIEDTADFASSNLEPGLMDRRIMNNVVADDGSDPLPAGAPDVAGAMALLMAINEVDEDP